MSNSSNSGGTDVNLDAKGRMALPTRYREKLAASCEGRMVLTIHGDGCLLLYPAPEWEEIERKLIRLPNQNPAVRRLQRMLLGHATEVEMDGHGRILLPSRLREFADLEKRVVLAYLVNKFEIWNEEAWARERERWINDGGTESVPEVLDNLSL